MERLDFCAVRGPNQSPETALWRAVLNQAKGDLSGRRNGTGQNEADNVRRWVGTVDFVRVCLNADVDPEKTEAEFLKAIEGMEKDQ